MSRDVLIVLLVLGITANVGLIAAVVWLNHRSSIRPRAEAATDPGAPVAADDPDPARLLAAGAGLVDQDWIDIRAGADAPPASGREVPGTASTRPPDRLAPAPASGPDDPGARRPRRFALPDRHEREAPSDRGIAAVLAHPAPSGGASRAGRRRHRARRPPDAPVRRTDMVLSLGGATADARIVRAMSAALRGTVRPSDRVVELPGGRLRVTLETDAQGGEAFVRRARGVVRPWLAALDPDLELQVDIARSASHRGAASP